MARIKSAALALTTAISLSILLALALVHRRAISELSVARDKLDFPYIGMYVPVATATGEVNSIVLGNPTSWEVLYFYNTTCAFCKRSIPAVRKLSDELSRLGASAQLVAISRDGLQESRSYLADANIDLPAYNLTDIRTLSLFHVQYVPVTMVVSSVGKIVFTHLGPLGDMEVAQVIAAVEALDAERRLDWR